MRIVSSSEEQGSAQAGDGILRACCPQTLSTSVGPIALSTRRSPLGDENDRQRENDGSPEGDQERGAPSHVERSLERASDLKTGTRVLATVNYPAAHSSKSSPIAIVVPHVGI